MNKLFLYVIPFLIFTVFLYSFLSKQDVYFNFISGVNGVIDLLVSIFPYVCAVLIMCELVDKSGLYNIIEKLISPLFNFLKIPLPLAKLILLKPFSGSGSLALLNDIFANYPPDSYIGKCASCIFGSSETIFYISAVYFSKCKTKKLKCGIIISLISTFLSCLFACFICKIM